MLKCCVLFWASCTVLVASINSGPEHFPTKGEVWPKPQNEKKETIFYEFSPMHFEIEITNQTCALLENSVHRIMSDIKKLYLITRKSCKSNKSNILGVNLFRGPLKTIKVNLTKPCEDQPHLDMDESYNLTVSEMTILKSDSIWGILRGMETLSQLFYLSDDYCLVLINATTISDFPRYFHRGLMLDTARHYISVDNILKTLDVMAMNKLNVFHWHIIDDQSFPYQSAQFPELSEKGAFDPTMVYTKDNITKIIEYARQRGIRVIPEFDLPGHTRSWGNSHPDILTECYEMKLKGLGVGPLHPLKTQTYKLIQGLYDEARTIFPDQYFHMGGDEVDFRCWVSNKDIFKYAIENNLTSVLQVHKIFMKRVLNIVGAKSTPIVWQDVLDFGVPLPKDAIVQVWKKHWKKKMIKVLSKKQRMLLSAPWYLDRKEFTFKTMYEVSPRQTVKTNVTEDLLEYILGGEACMWGEQINDTNVLTRTWPRASAVAEVLWSKTNGSLPDEALHRIEEHSCRMRRRGGVPTEPAAGPGFCII